MAASMPPPAEAVTMHALELGDPRIGQAVRFAGGATTSAGGVTAEALAGLNALATEFAQGSILIPALPTFQPGQPNKHSALVNRAKEQGNAAFRDKRYEDAIKAYTIAAQLAAARPLHEASEYTRQELSVILCNRSAAYAAAEKWIEALCDADAACKMRRNWTKAWWRKGKALTALGRLDDAREAYLLGLEFDPSTEARRRLPTVPDAHRT